MARPRKTSEQRLAEANTAKLRAEFDILAERAVAAGVPAKEVAAIRRVLDLADLLNWTAVEVVDVRDHINDYLDGVEQNARNAELARSAAKREEPAA